jgi:predicted DsbA family dithiol-disulfide isomerase
MSRHDLLPTSPRTIVVYSDLNCSFAHIAIHRLHETRRRLGLEGIVWFEHRAFPLELFNERVNRRPGVDSEVSVVGALEPGAGWQLWQRPDWEYPVTTLPALEAVQAAKAQGWAASEQLDRGLRRAFWGESRCISMRHVIVEVANEAGVVDTDALMADLDSGRARQAVIRDYERARGGRVRCSPHVFLYDGTESANPGIERRWINGEFGVGFPFIDSDDSSVYDKLLTRAAELIDPA